MQLRSLLLALIFAAPGASVAACDLPRPPSAAPIASALPAPSASTPAKDASTPDAGPTFAEPDGLFTIAPPTVTGCTFTADKGVFDLGPTHDQSSLVSARDPHVTATMAEPNAWIEMETRDVRLRGYGGWGSVRLYAKRPLMFTDCCALGGETRLYPTRSADGNIEAELYFGDKQKRIATFACDDVGLVPAVGTTPMSLMPGYATGAPAVVIASFVKPAPLADTADGPFVSELDSRTAVHVLGRDRGRTRVAWMQHAGVQVGWVPSGAIAPAGTSLVTPSQRVMILTDDIETVNAEEDEHPPEPPKGPRWICPHEVRLVLNFAGWRSFVIGSVRAGTRLAFTSHGRTLLAEIARKTLDISVEEHTTLFVPRRDLEGCKVEDTPRE